jgi:hypothetical protein
LLSITGLARFLGVTEQTVRIWTNTIDGFPQRRRVGTKCYYLRDEVMDWLRRQPQEGREADAAQA